MSDPAIQAFFAERKKAWLKKNIKTSMDEEEIRNKESECNQIFSSEQWLPNAAKRAGQISISSHPCTFSHPSARKNKNGAVTSIIAQSDYTADGFLRTGNVVAVEKDALGNAAALDVYKFLVLIMDDDQPLLDHIKQDSPLAKTLLSVESESYENLKQGFLAMTNSGGELITSSKIKQVYFPVADDYHQLSILSNSGMIYEMRRRIDELRFSEKTKTLRELKRKNEYSEEGFSEIYDITTIGYGGTKPQNISVLNSQNGGKTHLLLSVPPRLEERVIRFPLIDFFVNSIRYYDCFDAFKKLHGIFTAGIDSDIPRRNLVSGRDHRIEDILDVIIKRMWAVREVSSVQYREESSQLAHYQKVWLLNDYQEERERDDQWLDELCNHITRWIMKGYSKLNKKPVVLAQAEKDYINALIKSNKEVLR
ncbi:MAG: type I-F CRISPR-associated protein Csy1 [Ostreibacterium sp.]